MEKLDRKTITGKPEIQDRQELWRWAEGRGLLALLKQYQASTTKRMWHWHMSSQADHETKLNVWKKERYIQEFNKQ